MKIKYVIGDATQPQGDGPKIIVHIRNDTGEWGDGFVMALSARWKEPEIDYRRWTDGWLHQKFELGQVRFVSVGLMNQGLVVANLIGQRGLCPETKLPSIRYEAIREGLGTVAVQASVTGASIHMPRIGCGLAGGKWSEIEPIVMSELVRKGIEVTVYDLKGQNDR